jgi:ribosomal protein RSM22 (predicted rRNA methylase)
MISFVSKNFEISLLNYIKETYLPDRFKKSSCEGSFTLKDLHLFSKGAADLSDAFTCGRRKLPKNYFNKKENRSAYLLYFTLTNFAKTIKCLDDIFENALPPKRELKILDLGCGPATSSIACSEYFAKKFPDAGISILGIDQNSEILNDGRRLFRILGRAHHKFDARTEEIRPANITRILKDQRFDLIIAANVLNEFDDTGAMLELAGCLTKRHANENAAFVIIDPALQKTARQIMELRDLMLETVPDIKITCPCTHDLPCPMLSFNRRDWCHFYLEWECPPIIRNVDRLLGIKHDYLKMAYLVFKKSGGSLRSGRTKSWRIVSSPLRSKGKVEFVLCGEGRLRRIMRLDKDSSEKNAAFDKIKRGDLIALGNQNNKIEKNTKIIIEKPFNFLSTSPA